MEIIIEQNGRTQKLFTKDVSPNPALRNAFQTSEFRCSVKSIQLNDQLSSIVLSELERIACFQVEIINLSAETIRIYTEDFTLRSDLHHPVYAQPFSGVSNQLPDVFELEPDTSIQGVLVFTAHRNAKHITLRYQEYVEDYEGKVYKLKYSIS